MVLTPSEFIQEIVTITKTDKEMAESFRHLWSPQQITVVVLRDCYFFVVVKHDPNLSDAINEFKVSSLTEFKNIVESKILVDDYWKKESTLLDLTMIFGLFLDNENNLNNYIEKMKLKSLIHWDLPAKGQKSQRYDGYTAFYLDITKNKPKQFIAKIRKENKKEIKKRPFLMKAFSKEYSYLFCAFWYPLFVFENSIPSLGQKFVIQADYKGYKVFLSNLSFIGVLSPIDPPLVAFQPTACTIMNEIISVANLYGVNGASIEENDLFTLVLSKDLSKQVGIGSPVKPSYHAYFYEKYREHHYAVYNYVGKREVNRYLIEQFKDVLQKAEKIAQNIEIKSYLTLSLDAKSHLLADRFKTAFLLAWIVVEKYLDTQWVRFLCSKNIGGDRLDKLAKSALWTADDELETLNLVSWIPDEQYNQIMRLKRIRNAIVHKERTVVKQEAEECVTLSDNLTKKIIRETCFIE